MSEEEKRYVRKIDATEDEVNVMLDLGYTLSAITPTTQEFIKNGIYRSLETQLVYHFLLKQGGKK